MQIFLTLVVFQMSSWWYVESSSAIDELLLNKTYDPTLRPLYGRRPLEVSIQIYVATLGPINEQDMTFHLSFHNQLRWNDPRLIHNGTMDEIVSNVHPGGKIWVPDVYVVNSREVNYMERFVRTVIKRNGDVYLSEQVAAKCTCFMDLASYPMDNQTCHIEFESYAYSKRDVRLIWYDEDMLDLPDQNQLSLTGYVINKISKVKKERSYGDGEFNKFANIFMYFHVRRTSVYFAYKAFLPTIFLTLFNIGSYFIPDDAMPARVTLIITTFLANMLILQSVSEQTTKVSYTTAMQMFLLVNLIFLVASILQYLTLLFFRKREAQKKMDLFEKQQSNYITKQNPYNNGNDANNKEDFVTKEPLKQESELHDQKHSKAKKENTLLFLDFEGERIHLLDRIFRVLMPSIYILFCAVYFGYYLS